MPKRKRVAVGFYKDDDGKTRPITKPSVKRKRVIQKPRRFKGVAPQQDLLKAKREALQIAKRTVTGLGGKVLDAKIVGGMKTATDWRKDIDVLVTVEDVTPLIGKKYPLPFVWLKPHRPAVDIFLVDKNNRYVDTKETIRGAEGKFVWSRESPKKARARIAELEEKYMKLGEQIHDLEQKMFKAEGRRADVFYRQVKALDAQQKDINRQIDRVLEGLPREEQKKIVREQFAAARVMVERELGGKLTAAEKWAGKRLYRKKPED